jgi:hypothetical protein
LTVRVHDARRGDLSYASFSLQKAAETAIRAKMTFSSLVTACAAPHQPAGTGAPGEPRQEQ